MPLDPYPKDPELLQVTFPIAIDGPLAKPRVEPQKLAIIETSPNRFCGRRSLRRC